jgi:hypothetical protein
MGVGIRELVVLIFTVGIIFVILWPYGRVLSRLVYSPWLAVLMLIPLINIISLWVFAYADWPAHSSKSLP